MSAAQKRSAPPSERRLKVAPLVEQTPRARLLEMASWKNDRMYVSAISEINALHALVLHVIDTAVEAGSLQGWEHREFAAHAGASACGATASLLLLRQGDEDMSTMLAEVAKSLPEGEVAP